MELEIQADEKLIKMVAEGDAMAFEEIDRRWRKLLVAFINVKVSNLTDADDLAQEVLFKAWERAGQYSEASGTFRAWIKRMAMNAVVDSIRHSKRKKRGGAMVHGELCEETLQSIDDDDTIDYGRLTGLVQVLPCNERRAIRAMLDEKSVAALAEKSELTKQKIVRLRQSAFDRMRESICERTDGEITIREPEVCMHAVQQTLF